ncbi:hypothetical protein FKM82_021312 [Ascaphus truei]
MASPGNMIVSSESMNCCRISRMENMTRKTSNCNSDYVKFHGLEDFARFSNSFQTGEALVRYFLAVTAFCAVKTLCCVFLMLSVLQMLHILAVKSTVAQLCTLFCLK